MFLKERRISFHFVDLNERSLSPGELDKIIQKAGASSVMDENSKTYKEKGYAYRDFDVREEVLEDNSLLRTPILRADKEVLVGFDPKVWKELFR